MHGIAERLDPYIQPLRLKHKALAAWIRVQLWSLCLDLVSVVHPLPILVAIATALSFASLSQIKELYLRLVEDLAMPDGIGRAAAVLVTLWLLSSILFALNEWYAEPRIDRRARQKGYDAREETLKIWVSTVSVACALSPLFGVLIGLGNAYLTTQPIALDLKSILRFVSSNQAPELTTLRVQTEALIQNTATLRQGLLFAIGIVIGTIIAMMFVLSRWPPRPAQERSTQDGVMTTLWRSPPLRWLTLVALGIFAVLFGLLPYAIIGALQLPADVEAIAVYRNIGALAVMTTLFAALAVAVAIILFTSRATRFPMVAVCATLLAVAAYFDWRMDVVSQLFMYGFGLIAVVAFASRTAVLGVLATLLGAIAFLNSNQLAAGGARSHEGAGNDKASRPTLEKVFTDWLEHRKNAVEAYNREGRPYPLFVVAAQGGGIYAASSANFVLSRLQRTCSSFADHTFAISGVSGGAVGAALFQTGLEPSDAQTPGCRATDTQSLATAIDGDDHLSALLGIVPLDWLGLHHDRTVALERSFVSSAGKGRQMGRLMAPFAKHWSPTDRAPALVLNATLAETGTRAVFAPFQLNGGIDGQLFAFNDSRFTRAPTDISVVEAAFISARFPGVTPAYGIRHIKKNLEAARWNFVDGGYVDASGAATAVDLVRLLRNLAGSEPVRRRFGDIDVRLLLLSETPRSFDAEQVKGGVGKDFTAPLSALFNARERSSRQAIDRAFGELAELTSAEQRTSGPAQRGERDGWRVAVIEFDTGRYALPLGWTISRASHAAIGYMVGQAGYCVTSGAGTPTDNPSKTGADGEVAGPRLLIANSCVLEAVRKVLSLD